MTYHKQFLTSEPCAPGLCRELCIWMHDHLQHDGHHSFSFTSHFDGCIYDSYGIRDLNCVSEYRVWLGCNCLTQPQRAGRYHAHWLSVNDICSLSHWHGLSDPCTCIDELSCLTIWSLKSSKCWQVAKWVQVLHFKRIQHHKCQFDYSLLRRHSSRHHVFIGILFPYGNLPVMRYAGVIAYRFIMLGSQNWWAIRHRGRREGRHAFVRLPFLQI